MTGYGMVHSFAHDWVVFVIIYSLFLDSVLFTSCEINLPLIALFSNISSYVKLKTLPFSFLNEKNKNTTVKGLRSKLNISVWRLSTIHACSSTSFPFVSILYWSPCAGSSNKRWNWGPNQPQTKTSRLVLMQRSKKWRQHRACIVAYSWKG